MTNCPYWFCHLGKTEIIFDVNYECTDDQLIDWGIDQKILDLRKQPLIRAGAKSFDHVYASRVEQARSLCDLASLSINNDGRSVHYPPGRPYMGFVPN